MSPVLCKLPFRRLTKLRPACGILVSPDWIEPVPGDSGMAWCRRCHAGITCHPRNVMAHAVCQKHRRNAGATPMSAPETVPRRLWRGARARPNPPRPIPYWQRRYYDYRSGQKSAAARPYPGNELEAESGDSGSTRDASVQISLVTRRKVRRPANFLTCC